MAHTPNTITVGVRRDGPVTVIAHGGGFVEHGEDGRRAIVIGFTTADGHLVTIPREVFDEASAWIAAQETPDEPSP